MTDLLSLTADLVAVASESHAEGPLVDQLEAELRAVPWLTVDRVGLNLVARTTGRGTVRVLLAGHTDTVPANGNAVPRREGDTLWGLGTADMKGGLAAMVELALAVPEPAVDVTYVFYAREEIAAKESGLEELFVERPDLLEDMPHIASFYRGIDKIAEPLRVLGQSCGLNSSLIFGL